MLTTPARNRVSELDAYLFSIAEKITNITLKGEGVTDYQLRNGLEDIFIKSGIAFTFSRLWDSKRESWDVVNQPYDSTNDDSNSTTWCGVVSHVMDQVGLDDTTKEGRFAVRFVKYFKTQWGIKLSSEIKSAIGNAYNVARESDSVKRYDITNDFNWDDGDYGHGGSCWWGCYGDSRDTLYMGGGFCLRGFNDNDYGISRTWILPTDNQRVYLFNAYGIEMKESARIMAKLLTEFTGIPSKFRKCTINDTGYIYVNPGSYVVYPATDTRDEFDINIIDYCEHERGIFNSEPSYDYLCDNCGTGLNDDDDYYHVHDDILCEHCYNRIAFSCPKCDESEYDRDGIEVDGKNYCNSCAEESSFCDNCGDRTFDNVYRVNDDAYYCESCFMDQNVCAKCNEGTTDELISIDEIEVCESCASEANECPLCHVSTYKTLVMHEGLYICEGCKESEYLKLQMILPMF